MAANAGPVAFPTFRLRLKCWPPRSEKASAQGFADGRLMPGNAPRVCSLSWQKDTLKHVRETGAFVVNLVDEAMADRMNICSVDFPSHVSEVDAAGFDILPGVAVPVPRIVEAPVALECRHYMTLEVTFRRHLCIGMVVHLHARPGIIDAERLRVNFDAYKPVARLFGNFYARLGEKFVLKRQSFAEWQADTVADALRQDESLIASRSPALAEENDALFCAPTNPVHE